VCSSVTDWDWSDLFAGAENVLARVVEEHLGAGTAKTFGATEEKVNSELDKLREQLRTIDPTLADALKRAGARSTTS